MTIETRTDNRCASDLTVVEEVITRDCYHLNKLKGLISPAIIMDIGGHIGCFGLKARETWPDARLAAYEPNAESAILYQANNPKAEVRNAAVSYDAGKTMLAEDTAATGGGILTDAAGLAALPGTRTVLSENVELITLEDVLRERGLDRIDLLKLDCEGSEIGIIERMLPETAAKIGFIVGEYHYRNGGYAGFEKLLKARFPDFAVIPLNKPGNFIGLFAAGPPEIIGKLAEQDAGALQPFSTPAGNVALVTFIDGAKVEIQGNVSATYAVRFINDETGECVYGTEIQASRWAQANPKYYVPWRVIVEEGGVRVVDHLLCLHGKRVLISLSSKSLGDTVAWAPYAEDFRQRHSCEVHVTTFWRSILETAYPEIVFYDAGKSVSDVYASYVIGCFDDDYNRNPNHWRAVPVQQAASDCLGLTWREIQPRIVRSTQGRPIPDRYVTIAEFSTFHAKQWLRPGGWQQIVDWLTCQGYRVASISKEPTRLCNVVAWNNRSIAETIRNIQHSALHIGVSNGPMWLAHSLGIPTVVISGFTLPYSEITDCYRVINEAVCTGCYNDFSEPFDRNNWHYCPRGKAFECSMGITVEMVKEAVNRALHHESRTMTPIATAGVRRLFIAPHLSTGGQPQYTLQQVQKALARGEAVEVVEWTNLSNDYVVQRKKIQKLCQVHTLNGSAKVVSLSRVLHTFKPTVVHLQEFAETFLPEDAMAFLYARGSGFTITETTHNSSFMPSQKRWLADKIEAVCRYHQQQFAGLGIPVELVPYEVPKQQRPDRTAALEALGLDAAKRHVLNVGLFTPGKNQGEVFEVARLLPDVQFHFVGNQAGNFAGYWKPLMDSKPVNCRIWGEREDVERFYGAMDALLFTSTSELAPLVVKEALAWSMPVLMRNLPIYLGQYDGETPVRYLDGSVSEIAARLLRTLEEASA